jgi:S-adenosylmethionine:diacylglycerol 3-amino-3-carboxypropyl transferase
MIRVPEESAATITRVGKIFSGGNNLLDDTAQLPTTLVTFDTLLQHNISIKKLTICCFQYIEKHNQKHLV